MKRLGITTLVGALLGAVEGGIAFCGVLLLESGQGQMLGGVDAWIFIVFIIGLIVGFIFGGIIGLVVTMLRAQVPIGLAVGIGLGLLVLPVVVSMGFPLDYITIVLVLAAMLGGASIGLATAALNSRAQKTSSE